MVIFVDFDGVMHPEDCVDPSDTRMFAQRWHLDVVVRRLRHRPRLVISSAWRITRQMSEIERFFPADIGACLVGKTPVFQDVVHTVPDRLHSYPREAECWTWLRCNNALGEPWLAIDDQPGLYRPFSKNLYIVDPATGLTENDVPKLMEVIHGLG